MFLGSAHDIIRLVMIYMIYPTTTSINALTTTSIEWMIVILLAYQAQKADLMGNGI